MKKAAGANYIGGGRGARLKRARSGFSSFIAVFAVILTIATSIGVVGLGAQAVNEKATVASASLNMACSAVIGGNMESRAEWGNNILSGIMYPDASGRTFTLQEIAGSPAWVNYTGTGEGDWAAMNYKKALENHNLLGSQLDIDPEVGIGLPKQYGSDWSNVSQKLEGERTFQNCVMDQMLLVNMANFFGLGLANVAQSFVGWVTTITFSSNFICNPSAPVAGCFDLVKIIGGDNDASFRAGGGGGGIMGSLTNSIFKPLVLFVVVLTALSIAWTGIVKFQLRKAFGQVIWLVLSFIIGLALLLSPSALARAPMVVGNSITGCVIGAFNGVNCFTGGYTSTSPGSGGSTVLRANQGACISDMNTTRPDEITAVMVNGMTCTIWKTFILQSYAKAAFGVSLDELDTFESESRAGKTIAALSNDGSRTITPESFCYTLRGAGGSYNDYSGDWLETSSSGPKICNLAVYSILMQHKVQKLGAPYSAQPTAGTVVNGNTERWDPAWYDLIVTTASDGKFWYSWTAGWEKSVYGFVAFASIIIAGLLIVVASFMALMYYLMGIMLMIMAPLFILVGLNPGRGKKIMLGWLETVISSLLKYLASAIFLLVALALYSAVIGATDPTMALILVIIMTLVLWMYRKDIVEMFGKVSLGGERMANIMSKDIPLLGASGQQLVDKAKSLPSAAIGGAIGGAIAGNKPRDILAGANKATRNELRSTPGMIGRSMQAIERQGRENVGDARKEIGAAREASEIAEQNVSNAEEQLAEARNAVGATEAEAAGINEDLNRARSDVNATETAAEEAQARSESIEELTREAFNIQVNSIDEGVKAGKINADIAGVSKLRIEADFNRTMSTMAQIEGNSELADSYTQKAISAESEHSMLRKEIEEKYDPEVAANYEATLVERSAQVAANNPEIVGKTYGEKGLKDFREAVIEKQRAEALNTEAASKVAAGEKQVQDIQIKLNADIQSVEIAEDNLVEAKARADGARVVADSLDKAIDEFNDSDVLTASALKKIKATALAAGAKRTDEAREMEARRTAALRDPQGAVQPTNPVEEEISRTASVKQTVAQRFEARLKELQAQAEKMENEELAKLSKERNAADYAASEKQVDELEALREAQAARAAEAASSKLLNEIEMSLSGEELDGESAKLIEDAKARVQKAKDEALAKEIAAAEAKAAREVAANAAREAREAIDSKEQELKGLQSEIKNTKRQAKASAKQSAKFSSKFSDAAAGDQFNIGEVKLLPETSIANVEANKNIARLTESAERLLSNTGRNEQTAVAVDQIKRAIEAIQSNPGNQSANFTRMNEAINNVENIVKAAQVHRDR